ncbi:Sensor histidine kinase RcsC [Acaryochloris thomasi RCC1774]|uniref:Sensor histidine kinase RcsC n=1 Tax=Acaryochloris thomasi RCC1774 TaxID=1764569 RepID=A0A2W1JZ71_9CYAN|nr:response regulator [Acaryochloris thomasi]PZD74744.1 Sensor histidine kinase RcsC [Acaryochloris thomasi RCC1774]
MDSIIKLIEALATSAWPAIVFYIVFSYRRQVAALIESAKDRGFTIEVGGQKLSMKEVNQQQQNFIDDLQKQLNELRKTVDGLGINPEIEAIEPKVISLESVETAGLAQSNAILWVDDNPKNNSYFIELLQSRGYRVDLALSTSDGLAKLSKNNYRLILSDMGRTESGQYIENAGVNLLEEVRQKNITNPYLFYCSTQKAKKYKKRVNELGGDAITSSPTDLRAILDELAPDSTR